MFSESIHADIEPRLLCKFREIWLTGNRQTGALFTGQKNFRSLSRSRFCVDRAQICQGQLQNIQYTIYCEYPKFQPNPYTSGGVIARRVNIVEIHHKVFPILSEASSPSNNRWSRFLAWNNQTIYLSILQAGPIILALLKFLQTPILMILSIILSTEPQHGHSLRRGIVQKWHQICGQVCSSHKCCDVNILHTIIGWLRSSFSTCSS